MFSPKMIRSAAKHTGAVVRDRKISIVDLFWTLVAGFGAGKERTISGCAGWTSSVAKKKLKNAVSTIDPPPVW
jgi:hypothetical protein